MDQRRYPAMARIEAMITSEGLRLRSSGILDLEVRPAASGCDVRNVTHVPLFRRSVPVTAVSADADRWLSEVLNVPCRLMAFVPGASALNVPFFEVHSSLHDATPFHLTSEESLDDLNARARTSIPMNRFRPNVVVRGGNPYAEDSWKTLAVGDTVFRWVKPCTRCVATTTDQLTGERESNEPLATLGTYRRMMWAVTFGTYLMAEQWGAEMRGGEPIQVIETQDHPLSC